MAAKLSIFAAKFTILTCRGTAKFGTIYRDKQMPLTFTGLVVPLTVLCTVLPSQSPLQSNPPEPPTSVPNKDSTGYEKQLQTVNSIGRNDREHTAKFVLKDYRPHKRLQAASNYKTNKQTQPKQQTLNYNSRSKLPLHLLRHTPEVTCQVIPYMGTCISLFIFRYTVYIYCFILFVIGIWYYNLICKYTRGI